MEYPLIFKRFQEALREGKFLALRCRECLEVRFPPKGTCTKCGRTDFDIIEIKGEGIVKTFTVIRVPPEGMNAPYAVLMVELSEGPWAVGRLVGADPDTIDISIIGKKVKMEPLDMSGISGEDGYTIGFRFV